VALGPRRVRARAARRDWSIDRISWLRRPALASLFEELLRAERDRPLSFQKSVQVVARQRHHVLARQNRVLLSRRFDVELASPLVEPHVVAALARHGGRLGPGSRTEALRALVSDLLPDEVLARTSKATFGSCYFGQRTREFAAHWQGEGIDERLVDVERLRREWLRPEPHNLSGALLQHAWLASSRAS
jgi:asparagine synthase (glutamine-hydrolysing)